MSDAEEHGRVKLKVEASQRSHAKLLSEWNDLYLQLFRLGGEGAGLEAAYVLNRHIKQANRELKSMVDKRVIERKRQVVRAGCGEYAWMNKAASEKSEKKPMLYKCHDCQVRWYGDNFGDSLCGICERDCFQEACT